MGSFPRDFDLNSLSSPPPCSSCLPVSDAPWPMSVLWDVIVLPAGRAAGSGQRLPLVLGLVPEVTQLSFS